MNPSYSAHPSILLPTSFKALRNYHYRHVQLRSALACRTSIPAATLTHPARPVARPARHAPHGLAGVAPDEDVRPTSTDRQLTLPRLLTGPIQDNAPEAAARIRSLIEKNGPFDLWICRAADAAALPEIQAVSTGTRARPRDAPHR